MDKADLAILRQLAAHGADLEKKRHVIYYLYATSEAAAFSIAVEGRGQGYLPDVRPPLPAKEWVVVCELENEQRSDEGLETPAFFDDLAARYKARHIQAVVTPEVDEAGVSIRMSRNAYLHTPTKSAAVELGKEARAKGFHVRIAAPQRKPKKEWSVVLETNARLSNEYVIEARRYFQDLAGRYGAEYDGWEAQVEDEVSLEAAVGMDDA